MVRTGVSFSCKIAFCSGSNSCSTSAEIKRKLANATRDKTGVKQLANATNWKKSPMFCEHNQSLLKMHQQFLLKEGGNFYETVGWENRTWMLDHGRFRYQLMSVLPYIQVCQRRWLPDKGWTLKNNTLHVQNTSDMCTSKCSATEIMCCIDHLQIQSPNEPTLTGPKQITLNSRSILPTEGIIVFPLIATLRY